LTVYQYMAEGCSDIPVSPTWCFAGSYSFMLTKFLAVPCSVSWSE
jgi:hypothetical protein